MIAIIGGGPAALGAAFALRQSAEILERNSFLGKKLLLSGAGQCNFTNAASTTEFLKHLGDYRHWLKPAFYAFDNVKMMDLVASAGCPIFIREDGKVFPKSMKSADLRDSLVDLLLSQGTKIHYQSKVLDLLPIADGFEIRIAGCAPVMAHKVIIASGGASWPQTGSDGFSYDLAQRLGHEVLPAKPALAAVEIREYGPYIQCAGLGIKGANLALGKKRFTGDLLFTHQGFSGPVILDNSYLMNAGDILKIYFADGARLLPLLKEHPKKKLGLILPQLGLSKSLALAMLTKLGIAIDITPSELRAKDRKRLEAYLGGAEFEIRKLENLDTAMSDYGGVSLKEVSAKSMESKKIMGLFFAGESLAYSLPSGGFSIQMAFSTGYLAGLKAMNSI